MRRPLAMADELNLFSPGSLLSLSRRVGTLLTRITLQNPLQKGEDFFDIGCGGIINPAPDR